MKLPSSLRTIGSRGLRSVCSMLKYAFITSLHQRSKLVARDLPQRNIAGTADFVIVMEDLSDLKLVSQSEGMTALEARSAVGVLASIHATWWDKGRDEGSTGYRP